MAVVTGGSRGIGRAICEHLSIAGAVVLPISRSTGHDVTEEKKIEDLFSRIDRVDILVNCAGILTMKPFLSGKNHILSTFENDLTMEEWQRQIDVNIKGTFYCSKYAAERMATDGGGKIVNISSIDAIKGMLFQSAYSMTKGAIIALTKSLAVELGRFNINVNCVCPGFVDTSMTHFAHENDRMRKAMIESSPLRRLTETDDVASMVVFLCSDKAKNITGQIICVDAGVTA